MSVSRFLEAVSLSNKYQNSDTKEASLQDKRKFSRLFITISREAGAGSINIGKKLAEFLNSDKTVNWPCPWTVFDKELIKTVLEDHHLPERWEKYMPEDKHSKIQDILDELFGLHPASIVLVHRTSETILHLAQIGNVILVGRGASIITRKLEWGFHVRLVGSLRKRTQRVMEFSKVDKTQAEELIAKWDKGRKKYLNEYFNKNIDDPLLYDLIINTDFVSHDNAAKIIANAALCSRREN